MDSDGHPANSPRHKGFNKRISLKHHHHHQHSTGSSTVNSKPASAERQQAIGEETTGGQDHFPGGDAMLEVLTRLQSLQDSFHLQLQVCCSN